MKTTAKIIVAIVAAAALGTGAVIWANWPRSGGNVAAQPRTGELATPSDLEKVDALRTFFAHQSVGVNILEGVTQVYDGADVPAPHVTELAAGQLLPADEPGIFHTFIGQNGDPEGKLNDFAARIRGGIGNQVDVAVLKFCYIDFSADTDVNGLFNDYKSTMAALQHEFPEVAFVYSTVPLTTESGVKQSVKNLLGRTSDNAVREKYNELVRQTYGNSGRLFDVAAAESTEPDGSRVSHSADGGVHYSLYEEYAADEGHLNSEGEKRVASEFLAVLAHADGSSA